MRPRSAAVLTMISLALSVAAHAQDRSSYVPEPRLAKTDYLVGAHYFPGWKEGTHYVPWPGEPGPWGWFKIVPYPNRTPLLG